MATPNISTRARGLGDPADRLVPVIPADDADLPEGLTRGLFVGGAGELTVIDAAGGQVALRSAEAQYHPIRVRRILTATTATGIVALY